MPLSRALRAVVAALAALTAPRRLPTPPHAPAGLPAHDPDAPVGTPDPHDPANQCDGCRCGWPVTRGVHWPPAGTPGTYANPITCTADRYAPGPVPPPNNPAEWERDAGGRVRL